MHKKRTLSFTVIILLTLSAINGFGQEKNILKGLVIDGHRNPIIACNVMIKGTMIGTITDICGEFSIPFEQDDITLVFHGMSYNDMRAYEINLKLKDLKDELTLFQLGHLKVKNDDCKKRVDKKLKKYVIE